MTIEPAQVPGDSDKNLNKALQSIEQARDALSSTGVGSARERFSAT